jgi:hypothetical protein
MVTDVDAATPLVVIVNVALVVPAAMVTLAGTCATEILLDCRLTRAPPAGAAPLSVRVPVELFPPTTVLGVFVRPDSVVAFTLRVAFLVTP